MAPSPPYIRSAIGGKGPFTPYACSRWTLGEPQSPPSSHQHRPLTSQVVGVLAEFPVGDVALEPLDLVALVGQERGDEVAAEDVGELAVGLQRVQGIAEAHRQDLRAVRVVAVPFELVRWLDLVRDAQADGRADGG